MTDVSASQVLQCIQRHCGGYLELRALPSRARQFARVGDFESLRAFVARYRDTDNLYFAVTSRKDASSGRTENCQRLGALFADLDFGKSSESALRARLATFGLPPSILIHSGGGLHAYWLLDTPCDVTENAAEIKAFLRRLAVATGGDVVVGEVARVLRIPGTLNHKFTPPVPVIVERFEPARRYELSALVECLPELPAPIAPRSSIEVPRNWRPLSFTAERLERGRAYLRAMGPAVMGNGGDQHTYRAACWLVNDLDLSDADAFELLREFNATCSPPWTDAELVAKLTHAKRYGVHPRGAALLNDRPVSSSTVRIRVS